MTAKITVEIVNKKGLHARAAAKFVKIVASFQANVQVAKEPDPAVVPGGSILGLMMLGADPGSKLCISADGAQETQVIAALKDLVEGRFGEAD